MNQKQCRVCGILQSIENFHRNPSMADGRFNSCRTCRSLAERNRYQANPERIRARVRTYRADNVNAVRARDRLRGFRIYDRQKVAARRYVRDALSKGILVRQPCEVCGESHTDAHHPDYDQPLTVQWLCRRHHGVVHQRISRAPF